MNIIINLFCYFIEMFLSNLFKRDTKNKPSLVRDKLRFLGVDMHNHILPGLDDGSASIEESLRLLQGLKELGYDKFICTPHVMEGIYSNNVDTIGLAKNHLQTELLKHPTLGTIQLESSAEYMLDGGFSELIKTDQLCAMPEGYVLIEMSYMSESSSLFQVIFDLQAKGYKPILAHPERYGYYHKQTEIFKKIKDAGCFLQLNLLSISRYYGVEVRKVATALIKQGMYDFAGTDLHHAKHLNALHLLVDKYPVEEILKKCNLKNKDLK